MGRRVTPNQLVILRALTNRRPGASGDVEFDSPLYRAARSLERAGLITITQPSDGETFTAQLPNPPQGRDGLTIPP
jgi:hypothetical protein